MSETTKKKSIAGALLRLLGHCLFVIAIFSSFDSFSKYFAGYGPVEYQTFIREVTESALPLEIFALFCAMLLFALIINDLIDALITKRKTSGVFPLFFMLLLISAWSQSYNLISVALALTLGSFILKKFQDVKPFLKDDENRWFNGQGKKGKIIFWFAVFFVAAMPAMFNFIENIPVAVMVWAFIALTYYFLGHDFRNFLRFEVYIVFTLCCSSLILFLTYLHGWFDNRYSPIGILIGFFIFHAYLFFRNRKEVKRLNIAMLMTFVFVLVTVEMVLAPFNIGGRFKGYDAPFNAERPTKKGNVIGNVLPPGLFNTNPRGWWVEKAHFRVAAPDIPKPPNTYRIIVQGASATEGYGVEHYRNVWTAILEKMLNDAGFPYRIEVVNAGQGGTTTFGMLIAFKEGLLEFDPDMLLLYAAHNDVLYARGPFTEREMFELSKKGFGMDKPPEAENIYDKKNAQDKTKNKIIVQTQNALSNSRLYRLMRRRILEAREVSGQMGKEMVRKVPAVPIWDFSRNLNDFAKLSKKQDVKFVMVGEASRNNLTKYKNVMAMVAGSWGVPYLDANQKLYTCTTDLDEIFTDMVHLTIPGNKCIAKIIYDMLMENKILPESLE